jgi:hypothetical protein
MARADRRLQLSVMPVISGSFSCDAPIRPYIVDLPIDEEIQVILERQLSLVLERALRRVHAVRRS